jgi:hypothetical protein
LLCRYRALREFDDEHAWFRSLMNTVGKRLLAKSKLGAAFRLYSGAGLSIVDMVTDVSMIIKFMKTPGEEGYGKALAAMVGTCLCFQLLGAWVNTRKGPKREMAKEMLIVLSGCKPGIDAYRVASGYEQQTYAVITPEMDLGKHEKGEGRWDARNVQR